MCVCVCVFVCVSACNIAELYVAAISNFLHYKVLVSFV